MKKLNIVSLCDYTGNMLKPWAEAGHFCTAYDLQTEGTFARNGIHYAHQDVLELADLGLFKPDLIFAFPPCTDIAVSGARWFRQKGLTGLIQALQLVDACRTLAEQSGAPWMLENPVSTISTYWRKPDHTFNPHDFTAFELSDNYNKKTCLWTGGGFAMPRPARNPETGKPDNRISTAPPGPDRANFRSATPMGFARAVYDANAARLLDLAA